MQQLTNLYPATRCNSDAMDDWAIGAPARSNVFVKYSHKCFVLIQDTLVPTAFLDQVAKHVMPWNMLFDDDELFTAREMVGERYWAGLSTNERTVLGACLMILIEQGRIVLTFPPSKKKAA